jgi:1,4-alpha-glucan branching enzyme
MPGYFALVLHAHLPFVRHPEHARFLEESWLFEAITETYLPLLEMLSEWRRDALPARLTLSLSPTLGAMWRDPLLRDRYEHYLAGRLELAEKETCRTHWDRALRPLAEHYHRRFRQLRQAWHAWGRDLVGAFGQFQESGQLELITCAATHALLPLVAEHPPALRAQMLVARDQYRAWFGRDPAGFWLPECAYAPALEPALRAANLRWFIVDTHGLLRGNPCPRYGPYAPVITPAGLAAFARDPESAKQVWSRHEGYPGDPLYRDFYRDVGFDLDLEYVRAYLPTPEHRGFTGIKYHRITGPSADKAPYDRDKALARAAEHARHFLAARCAQAARLAGAMDRPPLLAAPYDAELFGHWWHEGLAFLDAFVRQAAGAGAPLTFLTPSDYLRRHPVNQLAAPSPSSWGEAGYWQTWLNERNAWILPHLRAAQERMSQLARRFPQPDALAARALRQAGRELLLAQASDWPFMLHTNSDPDYARRRVNDHLGRFTALHDQLLAGQVNEPWLRQVEQQDNLFPELDYRYWSAEA